MTKGKASKGGVNGSGLYYLGEVLNDAELKRFGIKVRLASDYIMALPYTEPRDVAVGDWYVCDASPTHAFRRNGESECVLKSGVRAARLVRVMPKLSYTIIPDNAP